MAHSALLAYTLISALREEAGTEAAVSQCLETLRKIAGNIVLHPSDPKYRKLKRTNKMYLSKVGLYPGGAALMQLLGFGGEAVDGEACLVMPAERLPDAGVLRAIEEYLTNDVRGSRTVAEGAGGVAASVLPDIEERDGDFTDQDYDMLLALDEQADVKELRASPQRIISALRPSAAAAEHTCYVCLDGIPQGSECILLRCGDAFHPQCILRWAHESRKCPICKEDIQ